MQSVYDVLGSLIMYLYHENLVNYILEVFRQTNFQTAKEEDDFFSIFGPGNTLEAPDRPFERFSDYQKLLGRLMETDRDKYKRMHKGTPFGFLSWLAFDLGNYEKGLFYLDAAISEDVKKADPPETWIDNPGPRILILDVDPKNLFFKRTVKRVTRLLQSELTRFNGISQRPPLDLRAWQAFVRNLIADPTKRTIISAIYVFLLEFRDHKRELRLREGGLGGSNQPFTVHLFTGGLIFESLLKHCYPARDGTRGDRCSLGVVLGDSRLLQDFGLTRAPSISADSLSEIHGAIQGSTSLETAFATAGKLRNTTGHNLVWDDIFAAPARYVDLVRQVINAILHVISRKLVP